MKKVIFFIDGFNVYHAISNPEYKKYKWLDFNKFANHFINRFARIEDIFYFTALAYWDSEKVKKHKAFIKAQESVGVNVVLGKFKKRTKKCKICHQIYETFEEKQTDVNIAIYLFKLAIENRYDKAFIVSGDSDLIPSVSAIKESFPNKEVVVIIPIRGRAFELKSVCDYHIQMKEKHLKMSQFSETVLLPDNSFVTRPESWK